MLSAVTKPTALKASSATAEPDPQELEALISARIRQQGAISFRDYMDMALYFPGLGYYTSGQSRVGTSGDFFTSCTCSPVFGCLIARQLHQMWEVLGSREFCVVEYGAGTGHLCKAVLAYFNVFPHLKDRLRYCIIEKNRGPALAALSDQPQVCFLDDISEISGFSGCVLSNELVDNLPVHRVEMGKELMEVFLEPAHGGFTETLLPAAPGLRHYLEDLRVSLPFGYKTEICLEAGSWMTKLAAAMNQGYFLTIDYGDTSAGLYTPEKKQGTLNCFRRHRANQNYYSHIGRQDITAFVNFSALGLYGKRNGLQLAGFREQGAFLEALGFYEALDACFSSGPDIARDIRNRHQVSHLLLEEMGKKFKVLCMRKNAPDTLLKGFEPKR